MGALSRRKGAQWERDAAKIFAASLGVDSKRGLGQARSAHEVADVKGVPGVWVECKCGQVEYQAALRQATEAEAAARAEGAEPTWPVVIGKKDRHPPFALMRLDVFLEILKAALAAPKQLECPTNENMAEDASGIPPM